MHARFTLTALAPTPLRLYREAQPRWPEAATPRGDQMRRFADALHSLILNLSTECAAQTGSGGLVGGRPRLDCVRTPPPPRLPGASAAATHLGQKCYLGPELNATVLSSSGFRYETRNHGRTPGLVADRAGAECVLRCVSSAPLRAGFLGVNLERGHRNVGVAEISCLPPCTCALATFDAHAAQKYTFSQRAPPRWAVFGSDLVCDVRIRVGALTAGHIMVHALTFSAALPGNRSVDTNTLYSLLG